MKILINYNLNKIVSTITEMFNENYVHGCKYDNVLYWWILVNENQRNKIIICLWKFYLSGC